MKHAWLVLAFSLAPALVGQEFVFPADFRLVVSFPVTPECTRSEIPTGEFPVIVEYSNLSCEYGGVSYRLTRTRLGPDAARHRAMPPEDLGRILLAPGERALVDEPVRIRRWAGRRVVLVRNGVKSDQRLFRVRDEHYLIVASAPLAIDLEAASKAFFDSARPARR